MKLSIIIPVYNAEKYLRKCLDSIFAQTFKDFEVICINDGSTDASLKILQEYKSVKILSQENQGPSAARNYGINEACGEYITFIDADDWIDKECFKTCFDNISNKDMLIFNYTEHRANASIPNRYYSFLEKYVKNDFLNFSDFYFDCFYFPLVSWAKLIRKDFLLNNNIFFNTQLCIDEDKIFWYKVLLKKPTVKIIDNNFYHYVRYDNSLSGQIFNALSNLICTTKFLINTDFFKSANILHQAIMLDWLLADFNYYWVMANINDFDETIDSLIKYFDNFDSSIKAKLKIYPIFKKIWLLCKIPFVKKIYVSIKKIPAPVLKKVKKLIMR